MPASLKDVGRMMVQMLEHTHDWEDERVWLGVQAQAASLRRITQGGLDEASILYAEGLGGSFGEAGRRLAEFLTQRWCHQCLLTFLLACSAGMPNSRMLHQCEHMPVQALGTSTSRLARTLQGDMVMMKVTKLVRAVDACRMAARQF